MRSRLRGRTTPGGNRKAARNSPRPVQLASELRVPQTVTSAFTSASALKFSFVLRIARSMAPRPRGSEGGADDPNDPVAAFDVERALGRQ